MIRNLKALGLALLAVFALGAVGASTASATTDLFTSNSANGKADLIGASVVGTSPMLEMAGAVSGCSQASYAGTAASNSETEITIHPVFSGACTFVGDAADVNTDGCDYILSGTTHTVGGQTHATVSIECTAGRQIEITDTVLGTVMHIPPQNQLSGITYTNKNTAEAGAGNETVTVKFTVKGITHTCTGEFCFLLENEGNGSNTVYTDDVIVTGYEDSGTFARNSTTHAWSGTHGPGVHIAVSS